MPDSAEPTVQTYLVAFQSRDFGTAARQGCALLRTGQMDYTSALALVVSLQHTGLIEEAHGLGELLGSVSEASPWHQAIFAFLVGKLDWPELTALMEDDQQRCQAQFYLAHRLLIDGEPKAAIQAFAACAKLNAGRCRERNWVATHYSLCAHPYAQSAWQMSAEQLQQLQRDARQLFERTEEPDPLAGLLDAFEERDFVSVVQDARDRLIRGQVTTRTMLMYMVALQHLGDIWEVESLGSQFLELTSGHPFPNGLLRLLLGTAEPSEVLRLASRNEDRCAVHFYAASRRLFEGDSDAARREFDACIATRASCREMRFARSHAALLEHRS